MAESVPTDTHQNAFTLNLGPASLGTFIVTAYVEVGGVKYWAPGVCARVDSGAGVRPAEPPGVPRPQAGGQ